MPATRPAREPLTGRFIRLEPFRLDHLPGLWTALGRPEVFAGGYGGGPEGLPGDEAAFHEWAPNYFPHIAGNTYVAIVRGGAHDGEVVGASSLADFDEAKEHAHIGWTGFDPRVWATQVNPEAKLLMLGLAFPPINWITNPVGWAFALWGAFLYWWAGIVYIGETARVIRIPLGASTAASDTLGG